MKVKIVFLVLYLFIGGFLAVESVNYTLKGQNTFLTFPTFSDFSFQKKEKEQVSESSMRLETYTGVVTLSHSEGTASSVSSSGVSLDSGVQLETEHSSHSFLSLDDSKTLRLDQNSALTLHQSQKNFQLDFQKGSLFFRLWEALGTEETFLLSTEHMTLDIQDASGILSYDPDLNLSQIVLLEGSGTLTIEGKTETLLAGQMALITTNEHGVTSSTIRLLLGSIPYITYHAIFIDHMKSDLGSHSDSAALLESLLERESSLSLRDFYVPILEDATAMLRDFMYDELEDFTQRYSASYLLYDLDWDGSAELFSNSHLGSHQSGYGFVTVYSIQNGRLQEYFPAIFHGYTDTTHMYTYLLHIEDSPSLFAFTVFLLEDLSYYQDLSSPSQDDLSAMMPMYLGYMQLEYGQFLYLDLADWSQLASMSEEDMDGIYAELNFPTSLFSLHWTASTDFTPLAPEEQVEEEAFEEAWEEALLHSPESETP